MNKVKPIWYTQVRQCWAHHHNIKSRNNPHYKPINTVTYKGEVQKYPELQSVLSSGYIRNQKSYNPPENIGSLVGDLCGKYSLVDIDASFPDNLTKFKLLKECAESFNHTVPNSMLHEIRTAGDLITFYETPIQALHPLEQIKSKDAPSNLHIQTDYIRFHPETDSKFGGVTAFPESSTIITDLKAKKKYPNVIQPKRSKQFYEYNLHGHQFGVYNK